MHLLRILEVVTCREYALEAIIKWFIGHEIISLPFTGGIPCGHQTSLRNWVTIKVAFRHLRLYLLVDMNQEWDLSFLVTEKISLGPLGNIVSERLQPCD